MQMHTLLLSLSMVLTGCLAVRIEKPATPTPTPPVAQEEVSRMEGEVSSASVIPLFGTGATAERMLESGILEIGNREAPLVLLSFTNHSCRYCRDFQEDLYPRLLQDFIQPGLLRYQVTVLPLRKYAQSREALTALICAGNQTRGVAMHDLLFSLGSITQKNIAEEIAQWPMDRDLFRTCPNDPVVAARIAELESLARSLDVTLVPTFFLNGEKFVGLPDYAELRGRLEAKQKELLGK